MGGPYGVGCAGKGCALAGMPGGGGAAVYAYGYTPAEAAGAAGCGWGAPGAPGVPDCGLLGPIRYKLPHPVTASCITV